MTAHIFRFHDWFRNEKDDWEADDEYLVIDKGDIKYRPASFPEAMQKLQAEFPEAIVHGDLHGDKRRRSLKPSGLLNRLEKNFPLQYGILIRWRRVWTAQ